MWFKKEKPFQLSAQVHSVADVQNDTGHANFLQSEFKFN